MGAFVLPAKQPVLGVGISATSYEQVTDLTDALVEERRRSQHPSRAHFVSVTSVHGIITAFFEPSFRQILNESTLATPDGMPVVWALRSLGVKTQQRVYGPTLLLWLCQRAAEKGHRIFLYGAREETLEALKQKLIERFPGLRIVGSISPPFRAVTPEEDDEQVRQILDSGADLVFVGLSTPKQEQWMISHRDRLPGLTLFGVGAAFDFHAGRIEQAPAWMQRAGLEWVFRLTREPKRLWKRYLLVVTVFPLLWALQKLKILRYE